MIKRTLYFGNPAYLSLRNAQLVLRLPEVTGNDSLPDSFQKSAERTIPIEDIGFSGLGVAVVNEAFLHQILYLLDGGNEVSRQGPPNYLVGQLVQLVGGEAFLGESYIGFKDRAANLGFVKRGKLAAALANLCVHDGSGLSLLDFCPGPSVPEREYLYCTSLAAACQGESF